MVSLLLCGQLAWGRVELQPCKNGYSPEQQIELGQKAVQQVYQQMPVLPDNSATTRYIAGLGQRLAAQTPGRRWNYNFHVANVAEINAFALPGGTIFVNLGTIQAAASESQLAGVMAHEISHVVLQHSVCNAAKQQRVGLIAGLGQVAAGVLLGGTAGQIAQQGIGLTAGLGFLKMSRGAEREADLMGVGILYDAGYDPRGMSQFFEILQQKYGDGGAQFTSDHPNPGNRSEYVEKEASSFVPKPNLITDSPAFDQIHKQVAGMRAFSGKEVSSGAWKSSQPNQNVSSGVNQPAGNSTAVDMNTSANWQSFQGDGFSMQVPGNWQGYGNQTSAMLAPAGGIARAADGGAGNVVYGLLTDQYQGEMRGLVEQVTRDNPGVKAGPQTTTTVGGTSAFSVECQNASANGGKGERDWIVGLPQGNGMLRYFVFVAPTPDFQRMRPVFNKIVGSISVQR